MQSIFSDMKTFLLLYLTASFLSNDSLSISSQHLGVIRVRPTAVVLLGFSAFAAKSNMASGLFVYPTRVDTPRSLRHRRQRMSAKQHGGVLSRSTSAKEINLLECWFVYLGKAKKNKTMHRKTFVLVVEYKPAAFYFKITEIRILLIV